MSTAAVTQAPWEKYAPAAAAGPWAKYGANTEAAKPQSQEQIDRAMGSPTIGGQIVEHPLTWEATKSGLGSVGRGITGAIRGIGATFDPRLQPGENAITAAPGVRMIRGIGSLAKQATEIPAAIRDINASPDPLANYAAGAQEAAGEGAGQALTGLATEGLIRGIPKTVNALSQPGALTAPVRLAARGTEAAINQKLVPLRPIVNIMRPADVAEATHFKIPGRDFGLPEPVPPLTTTNPPELPAAFRPAEPTIPYRPPLGTAENPSTLGAPPISAATAAPAEIPARIPETPVNASPANVERALNESLGGKPLVRGVSLRNQPAAQAAAAGKLPEGFTPVDSTALKGYKYDPATREFESITQGGQHYIHGDVSPEDAQAFADAKSKGQAWKQIRNNPLVAKVVDGERIAVKPAEMETAAGAVVPKAAAGMETPIPAATTTTTPKSGIRGLRLPEAFRSRSIGEEGIPYRPESHAQASLSEAEGRQFMPGRAEIEGQPQELIRTDLSRAPAFSVLPRAGAPSWIKFHAPVPETAVSRIPDEDLTPILQESLRQAQGK